jgi:hypothetical protein
VAYFRIVKTSSGATAVQVAWSYRRGSRNIEHIGPAHEDPELEALRAAARRRLAAGQSGLNLGLGGSGSAGPLGAGLLVCRYRAQILHIRLNLHRRMWAVYSRFSPGVARLGG